MARKAKIETRKDDAISIVKDESLVEAIEQEALSTKSDVLVEMSDTEDEAPVVEDALPPKEKEQEDEEDADEKKEKKVYKSELSLEDIAEVVRSTLKEMVADPEPAKVELSATSPVMNSEPIQEKSALDISVDNLYTSINSALQTDSTYEQKLESLNPVLAELGEAIKSVVKEKSGYTTPATVSNDNAQILEALAELSTSVKTLSQEVATVKAEQNKPQTAVNRVPVPRSINPVTQLSNVEPAKAVNPNSVANIVRRSVSSQLPLK